MNTPSENSATLAKRLIDSGLRPTAQREVVFKVILEKRDHPTADEIFARVKSQMPTISLATVYNCLETFVGCGLVRQVNHERESTRYCPNLAPHAHFRDKETGQVHDIELPPEVMKSLRSILPPGFDSEVIEISFLGRAQAKDTHSN